MTAMPWYRRAEYLRDRKPGPSCRWSPGARERVHRSFRAGYRLPRLRGPRNRRRFPRAVRRAPLLAPTPVLTSLPVFAQLSVVLLHMLSEQPRPHAFFRGQPDPRASWVFGGWHILQGGVNTPTLVQSAITPQYNSGTAVPGLTYYLPEPCLTGNLVVIAIQYASGVTPTIANDGPTQTWVTGPTDVLGGQVLATYYILNAVAGTRTINVTFSANTAFPAGSCHEFYNVATSGALDSTTAWHANGTSTAWSAGAQTTTADGDLIYHVATQTAGTLPVTFTAGAGLKLLAVDNWTAGMAASYGIQGTHGSFTASVTSSVNEGFVACAIAFKSAAAGTAPGLTAPRIIHMACASTGASNGTNSMQFQFPANGNLTCVGVSTVNYDVNDNPQITTFADSKGNSYATIAGTPVNSGNGIIGRIAYGLNATTDETLAFTFTYGLAWGGGTDRDVYTFYDIVGADTTVSSPTVDEGATSGDQETQGDLATVTVTATDANQLMIYVSDQDRETIIGLVGGGFRFDIPIWPGQDETGAGGAGLYWTKDVGGGHYTTTGPGDITPTQSTSAGLDTGVGVWEAAAVIFRPPPPPSAIAGARTNPFTDRGLSQRPLIGGLF